MDPKTALATFQVLAKKLVTLLQKPAATSSPALPAALEALGALGQVLPAVFAPHATAVADFVLDELLETPLEDCYSGESCCTMLLCLQSMMSEHGNLGLPC